MVGGDLELKSCRIVPYNWTMNTVSEELRQILDRRIGLRAKRIPASFDRLPLLNLVCFEPERTRIGHVRLAQILHRNRDARLAVTRSKGDPVSIDMKTPWLVAEDPRPLDLQ